MVVWWLILSVQFFLFFFLFWSWAGVAKVMIVASGVVTDVVVAKVFVVDVFYYFNEFFILF